MWWLEIWCTSLGGGFKYVSLSPLFTWFYTSKVVQMWCKISNIFGIFTSIRGRWTHFNEHIFQRADSTVQPPTSSGKEFGSDSRSYLFPGDSHTLEWRVHSPKKKCYWLLSQKKSCLWSEVSSVALPAKSIQQTNKSNRAKSAMMPWWFLPRIFTFHQFSFRICWGWSGFIRNKGCPPPMKYGPKKA